VAFAGGVVLAPPPPPPALVILLKVEAVPFAPLVVGLSKGDEDGPPPPPTVIGKVAAVTAKPSAATNGEAE
jgi:hypothetical protein